MKDSADRCPHGGHHRWDRRRDETPAEVQLRCALCGREYLVKKNPAQWARLMKGEK